MDEITPTSKSAIAAFIGVSSLPLDQHPAAVYLASLTSERSRRVMEQALRTIGGLLIGRNPRTLNIFILNWSALRYQHTTAVRSRLAEEFSPATANRLLSALRGVFKNPGD